MFLTLVSSSGHRDPLGPERAATYLREILGSRSRDFLRERAVPLDAATHERLRSLGYAD